MTGTGGGQARELITVALDDGDSALVILDQTRLPGEVVFQRLRGQEEIREAVRQLKVRGAPAIGVAAAAGLYLAAKEIAAGGRGGFFGRLREAKEFLAAARPTAVNLNWALERMEATALKNREKPLPEILELLRLEAEEIRDEDRRVCRALGEHGLALVKDGDGILTHCNAGALATAGVGTALAPIYLGREKGLQFRVFADETRPLLQGARLTAFELQRSGVDTTLICDGMASRVMKNGWVQAVFVGCDRLAANGDACNKIGTSGLAILAKHYGIPFYVFAPTSTIDLSVVGGEGIPIEERAAGEVTELWYRQRMAPEGIRVYNPAFDVTDHELVTAVVTEYGVARPPYEGSLRAIFGNKAAAGGR